MRISITCQCPHCNKPIFGQAMATASPLEVNVAELMPRSQIPNIVSQVARQTGVSFDDILGKSRKARISKARHIAWWACRNAGYPWHAIGDYFGCDHTSIIHGFNRINAEVTQ